MKLYEFQLVDAGLLSIRSSGLCSNRATSFDPWSITMPKNASRSILTGAIAAAASALVCILPAAAFAAAESAEQSPVVRSASGRVSGHGDADRRDGSEFVESETITTERLRRSSKGDSTTAEALVEEAWIYDASVDYFDDYDGDGYFTFLRVRFDADSIYAEHWVYARLFLTLDGVRWEEYHVTDDFLLEGSSAWDDFEVETELVTGFAPGLYDVLIELYDADYGYFLGDYGPVQSSAFSLLPLEDIENDTPPVVVVSSEHGGGGAAGIPALLGLALTILVGRRKRRPSPRPAAQSRNSRSAVV
jgi:hypothetical protein